MQPNKACSNSIVVDERSSNALLHDELSKATRALIEPDLKLSCRCLDNVEAQDCCGESLEELTTHCAYCFS